MKARVLWSVVAAERAEPCDVFPGHAAVIEHRLSESQRLIPQKAHERQRYFAAANHGLVTLRWRSRSVFGQLMQPTVAIAVRNRE